MQTHRILMPVADAKSELTENHLIISRKCQNLAGKIHQKMRKVSKGLLSLCKLLHYVTKKYKVI